MISTNLGLALLYLLALTANAEIILVDNFKNGKQNNMKQLRKYATGKELMGFRYIWDRKLPMVSEKFSGISVHRQDEYLIEPLTYNLDMRGKTLKIDFSSFSTGLRKFRLFTRRGPLINTQSHFDEVFVNQGQNQVGFIDLTSTFDRADLTRGYAFAFEGPLVIHHLELIDSGESSRVRQMD